MSPWTKSIQFYNRRPARMKFFVFLSLVAAATSVASHPLGGEASNSLLDSAMYEEDGEAASEVMRIKKHLHKYKTKLDSSSVSLQTPLTNIAIQKSSVRTRPLHKIRDLVHKSAEYLDSMLFDDEDAATATNAAANAEATAAANANAVANAGKQIRKNGEPLHPRRASFLRSYDPIFGTSGFETLANSANVGGPSGYYSKTGATATAEGRSYGRNTVAEGYSQSVSRVNGTGSSPESYAKTSATAVAESNNFGKNNIAEGHNQSESGVDGTGSSSESSTKTSVTAVAESNSYYIGNNTVAEGHSQSESSVDRTGSSSESYTKTSATAVAESNSYYIGNNTVAEGHNQSESGVDGTGSSSESSTKTSVTAVAESNSYYIGNNTVAEGHSQSESSVDRTGSSSESYTKTSATAVVGSNSSEKDTIAEGHSQSVSSVDSTASSSESYTKTSTAAVAGSNSYGKDTIAEGNCQIASWLDRFGDLFGSNALANVGLGRLGGNGATATGFGHSGSSFRGFGSLSGAKANADVFSGPGIGRTGLDFGGQRRGLIGANVKSNALAITGNNGFGGNGVAGGYSKSGSWIDGFEDFFGSNAKTSATGNDGAGFGQSGFSGAKADAIASAKVFSQANAYASANTGSFVPGVIFNEDIGASSDLTRMKRHLHTYKTKSDSSSITLETPRTKLAIAKSRVKTRPSHLHKHSHHF